MGRKETAFRAIIISIFIIGSILLVLELRPILSKEKLLHRGRLKNHYQASGDHLFEFENRTITTSGWLWKTYFPLNETISLYERGPAIVVRTEPGTMAD